MRAVVFFVVAYYFSLPAALTRVIPRHSTMKEEENGPQTKKSVALFGLSANPVTDRGGHGDIVKALLTRTVNDNDASSPRPVYDEVWVVPVYRHAFESKNNAMLQRSSSSSSSSAEEEKTRSSKVPNFQQRCEMCEKQFLTPGDEGSSSGRVKVKRIELEATDWKRKVTGDARATIIGTYELLEYLKRNDKKEKDIESRNIEYTFVMGRDAFDDLITGKWIRGDEILKTTNIVVVPRITSTTPTRAINEMSTTFSKETKSVVFLENITDLGNVSSSSVRESIKNGTKPTVIEELNPLVAKYIEENSLYE